MNRLITLILAIFLIISLPAYAAEQIPTVDDIYLGLSSGPLRYARLASLPDGILLKAADLTIDQKQIDDKISHSTPELQEQLRRNAFYVLEQTAARPILLSEAKKWMVTQKIQVPNPNEDELLKIYLESLIPPDLTLSDQEVQLFFDQNQEAFGEASLPEVREQVVVYLLGLKKQEVINAYIQSLSEHLTIEVNADWVKVQSQTAFENPVDQARRSNLPVMVDFGASGCIPCDMMAPILKELETTLTGKGMILFADVRIYQVLSARYGIEVIPTQVFFDQNGKEMSRHNGFFSKEDILKQLAKLGVE